MDKFIQRIVRKHQTNCPFSLAARLNITIMYEDLGQITKGFFHHRLRRNYIVLHYDAPYQQQRFTCAHEIGHFFFDKGTSYFMLEQNTLQLPAKFEHRANRFAVHLLSFGNQIEPGETITEFCLKHVFQ